MTEYVVFTRGLVEQKVETFSTFDAAKRCADKFATDLNCTATLAEILGSYTWRTAWVDARPQPTAKPGGEPK